jgi:VWFA-related protein
MQSGDLVAIVRTSLGNGSLPTFFSDKRQLLSSIENMRPLGLYATQRVNERIYGILDPLTASLHDSIAVLGDMPGRKFLVTISRNAHYSTYNRTYSSGLGSSRARQVFVGQDVVFSDTSTIAALSRHQFDRLADEALRAGVVVHTLDIGGLSVDNSSTFQQFKESDTLARKTGGMIVKDSNFFLNGIGDADNLMRGYYLISYIPPDSTFKDNRKGLYHPVKIKVKRSGHNVYSRDGFFGYEGSDYAPSGSSLLTAFFSPFPHKDLDVNLVSGYLAFADGYLLRSWLHLDAKDVTIVEDDDGRGLIKLKAVWLTSDDDTIVRDFLRTDFDFRVEAEKIPWVREHGIDFSVLLPVEGPNSYFVRTAVQDAESGKVGSVSQFVEIPDLEKQNLVLSNIFVINRPEDAVWIRGSILSATGIVAPMRLSPDLQRRESRSPALRSYVPGDQFDYMAVLYPADPSTRSDVEMQAVLYRGGAEVFRSEPWPVVSGTAANPYRIPIAQKFTLGRDLQAGNYVLQLLATDKTEKDEKRKTAAQTMSFEIKTP